MMYAIKLLVDPLVQPELVPELPPDWNTSTPFCELIAAIDSEWGSDKCALGLCATLYPDVLLFVVPAGSPSVTPVPDPATPSEYIVGFLDVLGFEALLNTLGRNLSTVQMSYWTAALWPQSEASHGIAMVRGDHVRSHAPLVQTAYFSDSLLLWVHYDPRHVPFFLDDARRSSVKHLPLASLSRGAISIGPAVLDKNRDLPCTPLIEAVRLESKLELDRSRTRIQVKDQTQQAPVPPDRVFPMSRH